MTDLLDKLERSVAIVEENNKLKRANGLLRLQTDMQRDKLKELREENARLRERLDVDEYNANAEIPALCRPQI